MTERQSAQADWRHVGAPRRPFLFLNPRSGNGTAARVGLADRARELKVEVVILGSGANAERLVRAAVESGADMLGVAGGDGSLAAVASTAADHGIPFACIPAGTRNHFALDLGLDRHDPLAALDAFTDAVEHPIDLAEVNGRVFLNNVSLGIYGDAVRQATYRNAKLRTLLETAEDVLAPGGKAQSLRIVDDAGRAHEHPAVVLVSNNPYTLDSTSSSRRPTLDGGRLGVIVIDPPDREPHPPGRAWSVPTLDVMADEVVHAGIDGEAVDLAPPLRFKIRPRALRIRVSSRRSGASTSGALKRLRPPVHPPGPPVL